MGTGQKLQPYYVLQVDSTIEAAKSLESLPSSPNFVEEGQSIQPLRSSTRRKRVGPGSAAGFGDKYF